MIEKFPGSTQIIGQLQVIEPHVVKYAESQGIIRKLDEDQRTKLKLPSGNWYAFPFATNHTPKSKFHARSLFHVDKKGNVFQFKGTGNISENESDQGEHTLVDYAGKTLHVPLAVHVEYGVYGGVSNGEADLTYSTGHKLIAAWNNLDPKHYYVKKLLGITGPAPFAQTAAVFIPLNVAGNDVVTGKTSAIPISHLPETLKEKGINILLISGQTTPDRIEYINKEKRSYKQKEPHIKALARHYKIYGELGLKKLFRLHTAIMRRFTAVAFTANQAGNSLISNSGANVMGLKDFNGHMFYDIDAVGDEEAGSFKRDLNHIRNQSDAIAKFLDLDEQHWQMLSDKFEKRIASKIEKYAE